MSPGERPQDDRLDERFFSILSGYDDHLVDGSDDEPEPGPRATDQLRRRLKRARRILRNLERIGRRGQRDMLGRSSQENLTPSAGQPQCDGDPRAVESARVELPLDDGHSPGRTEAGNVGSSGGGSSTGNGPTADSDTPQSGSQLPLRIGRFEIREELGQGGFGIVLRAFDPNLRRDVALKIPRFGCFVSGRERFLHEAWAAAGLDHPNIVQVYEAGEDGLFCYIASALCRGPDLAQWLKQRIEPVPSNLAARIMERLADAVEHAHSRGVLHRDLKPANVLMENATDRRENDDERGPSQELAPKITDFGLAKIQDEPAKLTGTSIIVGTAAYMSPEQAQGGSTLKPTADVYALGAILYELLTGRPVFQGENELDTLQQVKSREPIAPRRLRPKLPPDIETICLKCLEKEPAQRYGSAAELRDDLGRYLEGKPIRARPIRAAAHLWRWCRRNRTLAVLSGCLAASLLIIVIGSVVGSVRLADEFRQSKRNLIDAYLAQASAGRQTKLAGQRTESLAALNEAARLARELDLEGGVTQQLLDEAIACLKLADLRLDGYSMHTAAPIHRDQISFDRGGRRFARLEPDGAISVRKFADNSLIAELREENCRFDLLRISPNGRLVAARGKRGNSAVVCLWRLDGVANRTASIGHSIQITNLAFSPDGLLLAVTRSNRTAGVYQTASFDQLAELRVGFRPAGCCFDPQTTRLAVWGGSLVDILNLADKTTVKSLRHPGNDQVQSVDWSPDGGCLATGGSHHVGYVWYLDGDSDPIVLKGHQAWVKHVAFSQNGDLLATSSTDGTTRLWEYWTGKHLLTARGFGLRFADRDRWLVGLRGTALARWKVFSGRECLTLRSRGPVYEARSGRISSDGQLLACSSYHGFTCWDWTNKHELGQVTLHDPHDTIVSCTDERTFVITCSDQGVYRTRVTFDTSTREFHADAPQLIKLPASLDCPLALDVSRDGRILALTGHGKTGVIDLAADQSSPTQISDPNAQGVSVSCDGRVVVTFGNSGARLWSATTGQLAHNFPIDAQVLSAAFSPDGRWLVTDTVDELVFWRTGSWQPAHRINWDIAKWDPAVAAVNWSSYSSFSADGRLLAVSRPGYEIKLISPLELRVLATLPVSFPDAWISLSPDGTELACANEGLTVEVWNLKLIHEQLDLLGLAW